MPNGYVRPSLQNISDRVFASINEQLPITDATLQNTPLRALANSVIGTSHELFGFLEFIATQTNILTCTGSALDDFGQIWKVFRTPSKYAVHTVHFTGTLNVQIPSGSILHDAGGQQFVTTTLAVIGTTSSVIQIRAVVAGSQANLSSGTKLSLPVATAGVTSIILSSTNNKGVNTETDESYRKRLLSRISQPPAGGNSNDYRNWMLSQSGITDAFVRPLARGPGTVDCLFLKNNAVPSVGEVAVMQSYIDSVKPICADVLVFAPVPKLVNITISGLSPNTPAVRDAILLSLNELFAIRGGVHTTIHLNWVIQAISDAAGVNYFDLNFPLASVTAGVNELAVLGSVNYV